MAQNSQLPLSNSNIVQFAGNGLINVVDTNAEDVDIHGPNEILDARGIGLANLLRGFEFFWLQELHFLFMSGLKVGHKLYFVNDS